MLKIRIQSLNLRKNLQVFVIIVLVIILGVVSFAYFREKNRETTLTELEDAQKKEAQEIIKKLGRHIVLPSDEEPVIATIIDAEKLKQKSKFYELSQNGFKVILYRDRGILYDPRRDIIVSIASVSYKE